MAQIWICGGQGQLTKLVEIKLLVLRAIIFANDVVGIGHAWAKVVFAHKVVELRDADLAVSTSVDVLEKLHWLEIWVATQVLSLHFDLC